MVLEEWLDVEILALVRSFDLGDLYLVRHEVIQHRFSVTAAGDNPNPWMGLDKTRNKVWQKVLRNRLRSPDCQFSCLFSRGFRNGGKGLIGDLFHLIGQRQQHLAARG
jgi:hypothetical protein